MYFDSTVREAPVRKTSREIRRPLTQAPKFIYGVIFDF